MNLTPGQQQELRRCAQVMLDAADGKAVETRMRGTTSWAPTPAPAWNWGEFDYRIKPREPREFWMNDYGTYDGGKPWSSKEEADGYAMSHRVGIIHLREVLD